jgi:multidrug efflux system outer membrane protein
MSITRVGIIAVGTLLVLLAGCMVGPDYQQPEPVELANWHADLGYQGLEGEMLTDMAWFDIFQDEELQELILLALENNKNLLVAVERIEEARAANRVTRSALYPTLNLELLGEREDESSRTNTNAEQVDEVFFGLSAAWELDLWGGNRRASSAAFARYLSAEYGAQAVRLSVIADVSQSYFELQGTESRLDVNRDTLGAREQALVIAQKRHKGGLTSKLEVIQSQVELAQTRALLPKIEQQKLLAENQLALLLGEPPGHRELSRRLRDQIIPTKVIAGLPSTLMERRPDVMRAERELFAASESVGVATAQLFPNIRVTGSAGYESEDFDDMMDSDADFWILNLDVVMPLFNAGARRAQVTIAESRFNQARLRYEQVVLDAFREVSDSLNLFYKAGETLQAELELQSASTEYLSLAQKRYRNGVLAYIDVLDARRSLFEAQISVSVARQSQLFALVDLYKALGGGWDPQAIKELAGKTPAS